MCIARSLLASSMKGRFSSSVSSFHSAPEYKHVTVWHCALWVLQRYVRRVGLLRDFMFSPWGLVKILTGPIWRGTFKGKAQVLPSSVKRSEVFDRWIRGADKISWKVESLPVGSASNETDSFYETSVICCQTRLWTYRKNKELSKPVVLRRSVSCCVLWSKCTDITAERWKRSAKLHGVIFRETVDMNSIITDRLAQWFKNVSPFTDRV